MAEETPILLIVGLGNPGLRYNWTWHNLGYLALDYWAYRKNLKFQPGRGDYYHLNYPSHLRKITFIKPTSFMNLSGIPVGEVMRYRKMSPENVLIVCDDVALPFGVIRIRKTGSDGGQKGLSSVIATLGTEDIPRLRLGIYTEGWRGELSDYVLSKISRKCRNNLEKVLSSTADAIDLIIQEGLTAAMNRFNRNVLNENSFSEINTEIAINSTNTKKQQNPD